MRTDEFATIIRDRLRETRQTKHGAATSQGLPRDAISRVLAGHVPRLDRVAAICDALGLELYVGPKRSDLEHLDVHAIALALRDMRNSIILLANGHVEGPPVVEMFVRTYKLYIDVLDREVAAESGTREEAAERHFKRYIPNPVTEALAPELLEPRRRSEFATAEEAIEHVTKAVREELGDPDAKVEVHLPPKYRPDKP